MSESSYTTHYNIEPDDINRVEKLFTMIEAGIIDELVTDPVEAAFFRAALPELFNGGALRPHIDEAYALRRQTETYFPPGYDLRNLEFSVDKQMRRRFPANIYPLQAAELDFWVENEVFKNLDPYELVWDLQQNLQSNIANGYEVFKILSYLYKDRWTHPPIVVDTGVSYGLGLKKWALHETHPFIPYKMLRQPGWDEAISPDLKPDEVAQEQVNYLAGLDPIIGSAIGYDVLPINPHDQDAHDRVFSHTFPMSESLKDPEGVEEFESLSRSLAPNVNMLRMNIDATDPESLSQLKDVLPGGKADIFIFSAIIFEISPEKTQTLLENFKSYCNDGALIFASEFARSDPSAPSGLRFTRKDWWHRPGQFATFVIDPFKPEQPPQEFSRFITRRCEQMYLSKFGRRLIDEALA